MTDWLTFTVSVLACYRLSHMLAGELGPANLFKKLRMKFSPKTNLGKGVRCNLCWSVWCSFLITGYLVWQEFISWPEAPLWTFGITGLAVLIHKLDD